MHKKIVVFSYNGMLLAKKRINSICNNMGESQNHHTERRQTQEGTYYMILFLKAL